MMDPNADALLAESSQLSSIHDKPDAKHRQSVQKAEKPQLQWMLHSQTLLHPAACALAPAALMSTARISDSRIFRLMGRLLLR